MFRLDSPDFSSLGLVTVSPIVSGSGLTLPPGQSGSDGPIFVAQAPALFVALSIGQTLTNTLSLTIEWWNDAAATQYVSQVQYLMNAPGTVTDVLVNRGPYMTYTLRNNDASVTVGVTMAINGVPVASRPGGGSDRVLCHWEGVSVNAGSYISLNVSEWSPGPAGLFVIGPQGIDVRITSIAGYTSPSDTFLGGMYLESSVGSNQYGPVILGNNSPQVQIINHTSAALSVYGALVTAS